MNRILCTAMLLISGLARAETACAAETPRLRRPVDIAMSPDGAQLVVANRQAGTVSVVDVPRRSVVGEIKVGSRLSALAFASGGRFLLVTDEQKHELVLLTRNRSTWNVASRLKVAEFPVDLVVNRRGDRCYVSSLWSQTVTAVALTAEPAPRLKTLGKVALPFAPRRLCLVENRSRLIVADSFGGSLGILETSTVLRRISVKQLPGHNIRGLAVSGDGKHLLVAQQTLNRHARATFDDVHWGNMVANVVYELSLEDSLNSTSELRRARRATHLGEPGNAAGDPGPVAVSRSHFAVAFSGVDEVALGRHSNDVLSRVGVGKRPGAMVFSNDGKRLYVANRFSDSVSVIDIGLLKNVATVSLGALPPSTPARRGEELFYSARLSHDGWMSCHSCHTDGHTNGLVNDNLSDGSFGASKRVLSLLGVSQTGPWAWNGSVKTLDQQVRNSITKTMRGKSPAAADIAALVAYLKTLNPPPPAARFGRSTNARAIDNGKKLFVRFNCRRCHSPPAYTSPRTYDVGLKDEVGNSRFNPPSLRGVGRRRKLFHDGRAAGLTELFSKYRHQLPRALSKSEMEDLIQFLRTL